MAAVPMEFRGTLYDLLSRTARQVYLVGDAQLSGVGVGGGPIIPPGGGGGGGGGGPVDPGYGYPERPVDPGYGYPIGGRPHPEHPIVTPPNEPPPTNPPDGDGFLKPPPEGGWGYHATYGWLFNPAQAGPK